MIAGILLAAGQSSRMGEPKALLPYDGITFLDSILNKLAEIHCDPIITILGTQAEMICQRTSVNDYQCFLNPHPEFGMVYSLKLAIDRLPAETEGFILTLVDHPLVKLQTYQTIIQLAMKNTDQIIIPEFDGQKGHPVYFGKKYFDFLLDAPQDEGARAIVQQFIKEVNFVKVEDEGIIADIDTPDEYARLVH